jgi:hypothetical protein
MDKPLMGKLEQPLFFLHIPKAAGTSLRDAIQEAAADRVFRAYPPYPENSLKVALQGVKPDSIVYGHMMYGAHVEIETDPNYATVLRSPVERVCSWYRFMRKQTFKHSEDARSMPLSEMIRSGNAELSNHMTAIIAGCRIHGGNAEQTLDLAKRNLREFLFLSTDKRLADDMPRLGELLGVSLPALPHVNKSEDLDIPPEEIEIVRQANQLDISLFEFAEALLLERDNSFGR